MVKVYSKYNCKYCKQVKRLLKFSGIDYVEINVEDDVLVLVIGIE